MPICPKRRLPVIACGSKFENPSFTFHAGFVSGSHAGGSCLYSVARGRAGMSGPGMTNTTLKVKSGISYQI